MMDSSDTQRFDPQLASYCWLHPNMQPRNRDKVKLVPFKRAEGDIIVMGRTCPKCGNTVIVDQEKARQPKGKIEAFTQEVKPNGLP